MREYMQNYDPNERNAKVSLRHTEDLGKKTPEECSSIFLYLEKHHLFFEPGA